MYILLGDGKGNFTQGENQYVPAAGISWVHCLDLNGDGNVDLVAQAGSFQYAAGIVVALGNGDGTFQPGTFYLVNSASEEGGIGVGDFDGDGVTDVMAPSVDSIYFLKGNGDGTFQQPVAVASIEAGSLDTVTADFNGDGKLDLVVTLPNAGPDGMGAGFQLFFGNGDGTFQAPQVFTKPIRAGPAVAGPLHPGGPPAIVMTAYETPYVWVFVNDGKGNFSSPHLANFTGGPDLALADIDGDGYTDIVSSLGYVVYGAAGGVFPDAEEYPVYGSDSWFTIAVGDLNHDGKPDIVTDSQVAVSVALNEGHRQFLEGNSTPVTGGAFCAAPGDFNGDGKPDLAVSNATGVVILLGSGSVAHPFDTGETLTAAHSTCPSVADVNGDGIEDLVVLFSSGVATFLGNGDGTFTQKSVTPAVGVGYLVLGDFNRDGKLDFATSSNQFAYGKGDGTFHAPKPIVANPPLGAFSWIAVGDINNDGWPDLELTNANSIPAINPYSMLNNHAGGFQYVDAGYGAQAIQALLADVNGDGFLDLVIASIAGDGAGIFFGNGTGKFSLGPSMYGPINGFGGNAIADFNGDGIPDIACFGSNEVIVFPGLGGGTFGTGLAWGAGASASYIVPINILRPGTGFSDLAFPGPNGVTVIYNVTPK